MKRIAVLGSTGSIGLNTLQVIRRFPGKFRIAALSANSRIELLEKQVKEFRPAFVCVGRLELAAKLRPKLGKKVSFFAGEEGLRAMAGQKGIDKVVIAVSGSAALLPLLKAIECRKEVALANKESLVMAGSIIMKMAQKNNSRIVPIDSEQSAVWQCLEGENKRNLKNIYLTASGGPFRKTSREKLRNISIKKALRHPRWKMGRKISVDSATLMNKGLELIEAMFLFGVPSRKIKILIHPQAIIHSMVEFIDGVILAQLSVADMRIPIQYALSYPQRFANSARQPGVDFCRERAFDFYSPDFVKFPCLRLAYRVAAELGTAPAVLNAANEVSVHEFLKGKLKFLAIPSVIEKVLSRHRNKLNPALEDIFCADKWARQQAHKAIERSN